MASFAAQPKRLLHRGLPMSEQFQWKPAENRESFFSAQELIADLIRENPSDIERILKIPQGVDESVWILDHLKRFLIQLGFLLVFLEKECTSEHCPNMMATENFAYRCSVHGPRMLKNCNAVSYSLHTLDDFIRKFNHPNFQSRTHIEKKLKREYTQCCRRCYRIFAHAYWHHQVLFAKFESEHYLCTRFIMFIRQYKLIPEKIFKKDKEIPPKDLFFKREAREQNYKLALFQKEQRLKREKEAEMKRLKEQQEQAKQNKNNNTNNNAPASPDITDIKEDSDDSSSEDEDDGNNGKPIGGNDKGDLTDEEKALQEIYSDEPIL